jgi:hypothetical protein
MAPLTAFRNQLYHRHCWVTVSVEGEPGDRDEAGEIQLCGCGAARRRPDEPDEP